MANNPTTKTCPGCGEPIPVNWPQHFACGWKFNAPSDKQAIIPQPTSSIQSSTDPKLLLIHRVEKLEMELDLLRKDYNAFKAEMCYSNKTAEAMK